MTKNNKYKSYVHFCLVLKLIFWIISNLGKRYATFLINFNWYILLERINFLAVRQSELRPNAVYQKFLLLKRGLFPEWIYIYIYIYIIGVRRILVGGGGGKDPKLPET